MPDTLCMSCRSYPADFCRRWGHSPLASRAVALLLEILETRTLHTLLWSWGSLQEHKEHLSGVRGPKMSLVLWNQMSQHDLKL